MKFKETPMAHDLHKKILEQAREDGWSEHADINLDDFARLQQAKFFVNEPAQRMRALQAIDAAIGEQDGSSIRSKADLLQLRRSLSATHEAMLKAGK
jgi:hypothetical protein